MDVVMTRPRKAVKAPARAVETIPPVEAEAAPGPRSTTSHHSQ